MADLPVTSDDGALPVAITDPVSLNILAVEVDGSITAGEVVVMEVETGKGFSVVSEVLPVAATETAVFLIKNPNASGKNLKLLNLIMGLSPSVGSATGNNDVFRLYVDPTITTNGTALTVSNLNSETSPPATVMTAFSSPTIAANGTKLAAYDVSSSGGSTLIPQGGTRILGPNHSWLITQTGVVNGASTGVIVLEWVEE
jgi:hypothetical protein